MVNMLTYMDITSNVGGMVVESAAVNRTSDCHHNAGGYMGLRQKPRY